MVLPEQRVDLLAQKRSVKPHLSLSSGKTSAQPRGRSSWSRGRGRTYAASPSIHRTCSYAHEPCVPRLHEDLPSLRGSLSRRQRQVWLWTDRFCARRSTRCSARPSPSVTDSSRGWGGRISIVYLARHVIIDRLSAIKNPAPEPREKPGPLREVLREARPVTAQTRQHRRISDYGGQTASSICDGVRARRTMKKHMSQGLFACRVPPASASRWLLPWAAPNRWASFTAMSARTSCSSSRKKDGIESVKLNRFRAWPRWSTTQPPADTMGVSAFPLRRARDDRIGSHRSAVGSLRLGAMLYESIAGFLPIGAAIAGGRPTAGSSGSLPLNERVPHVPEPWRAS